MTDEGHGGGSSAHRNVGRLLDSARQSLGMDIAFITEVGDTTQRFAHLSGDAAAFGWHADLTLPATDGVCRYMLSGRLPPIIGDAQYHPFASRLRATQEAGIGAYLGVPLVLTGGRVYGALCVADKRRRDDLAEPDVAYLQFLARSIADELDREERRDVRQKLRLTISDLLQPDAFAIHLQPVVALTDGRVLGVEALARFPATAGISPATVFSAAEQVDLGPRLEVAAARAALTVLAELPDRIFLAVNVSPGVLAGDDLLDAVVAAGHTDRLTLELTEHTVIDDMPRLRRRLAELRGFGARVAVDDAGSGYSGLQTILALSPDVIKLDVALVRGVDTDPVRRALIRCLVDFAADTGADLIAEGIETAAELAVLQDLGVSLGQGFHLARPAPIDDVDLVHAVAV